MEFITGMLILTAALVSLITEIIKLRKGAYKTTQNNKEEVTDKEA